MYPSQTLKSKHSLADTGTEKKAKAPASVNMSGSTLLRLGGQITARSSLFAVWFQLHPKLHEIQMRHLLKGAWFYVAQLTVYWNTLNKNINTGEETWRPLGTPDSNAGWINSNLAPFSVSWSKQDPLKATRKPRPSLCVSLWKIFCSTGSSNHINFMPPSHPENTKLLSTWPGDLLHPSFQSHAEKHFAVTGLLYIEYIRIYMNELQGWVIDERHDLWFSPCPAPLYTQPRGPI